MNDHDLSSLYLAGRIEVDVALLHEVGCDDTTIDFLARSGLPRMEDGAALGLSFLEPTVLRSGEDGTFVAFARETWAPDAYFALDVANGHVLAVDGQPDGEKTFVNSSVPLFLAFVALAVDFFARASQSSDGPVVMTADQARERRATLLRGEITPAQRPASFDRQIEVGRLRQAMVVQDSVALRPSTWWDEIMEQIEDEQL